MGRTDDIIVFLNGEKTNPTSFENQMAEHPQVQAALVVGHECQEAALLVEPTDAQPLSDIAKKELKTRRGTRERARRSLCSQIVCPGSTT